VLVVLLPPFFSPVLSRLTCFAFLRMHFTLRVCNNHWSTYYPLQGQKYFSSRQPGSTQLPLHLLCPSVEDKNKWRYTAIPNIILLRLTYLHSARLLRSWVRIRPRHGYLSVVSVVCCQVEVSATS